MEYHETHRVTYNSHRVYFSLFAVKLEAFVKFKAAIIKKVSNY